MLKKYILTLHTLKYLNPKQLIYRLFYIVRNKLHYIFGFKYALSIKSSPTKILLADSVPANKILNSFEFTFLNTKVNFDNINIDWNYSDNGKLWTYNLNYFEYLLQKDISFEQGAKLIEDYIDNIENSKDGLEPYPLSLKGINWIKFILKHKINSEKINDSLYAQYKVLSDNLEYHLLGNHLLENGFSLLFGGYYFNDNNLYKKAKKVLIKELKEQILPDGAHFEISPMYHQIILFRTLDCYNLVSNNPNLYNGELQNLLYSKASLMLGHLKDISFRSGQIPHINDSTDNIAPSTNQLLKYARRLNIIPVDTQLNECGYRKFTTDNYELIADIGKIGPDYIPGHAHADTFNFVLSINDNPVIVDTGISTYEKNDIRQQERGTKAHNTVIINDKNSSDVWGGFRVGKRATVNLIQESENYIEAVHNGYLKMYNIKHKRSFSTANNTITIIDKLIGNSRTTGKALIHFNYDINVVITQNAIKLNSCIIKFDNAKEIKLLTYKQALGYNNRVDAKYVEVKFENTLSTTIDIKN